MHSSYGETGKDDTVPLYLHPTSFHQERAEIVNTNSGEWSFAWSSGKTLHVGKSAMSCLPAVPCNFLQTTHLDRKVLMAPLAPGIQNCWRSWANMWFHTAWAVMSWMCLNTSLVMYEYFGRMAGCLEWSGIAARLNPPPTLMTPSWRTGFEIKRKNNLWS